MRVQAVIVISGQVGARQTPLINLLKEVNSPP